MSEQTKVWIPIHIKEEAKRLGINLSKTLRDALLQAIEKAGGVVQEKEPVIILANCPYCHGYTQTSSIHVIRCKKCRNRFRVYTKRYGIRGKILKGETNVKKRIHVFEKSVVI